MNLVDEHPDVAKELAEKLVQQLDSQAALYPLSVSDNKVVKPEFSAL